ncbi:Ribonuclease MRP protein subunit rmp1 [Colletotrichum chlorophyti]|uniref:Ribonuclease MRP protein subunit rmp1 n=1 Tax=Colletotrichum chlorophyti TaxID=708187 RepID=A0A1Q8RBE6_9PEZI|nr:Ribonuclease MRP protein subunit rmp1 [Colletotrichum chlorophyti]
MPPGIAAAAPASRDSSAADEPTHEALLPILSILDGFNHRNKNQHRVACWWAQFDLLRRSLRRLADDLVARTRRRHAQSFKKKQPPKKADPLDDDIAARVDLLLNTTIPSSFLAFTQLTADNQHAALGLVLLGLLASVNTVIAPLVPHQADKGHDDVATAARPTNSPAAVMGPAKDQKQQLDSVDLGVAISRDQIKSAKSLTRRPAPDAEEPIANLSTVPKKRKMDAPLAEAVAAAKDKKREKKPGKKKSKKGDEFSDLFSSLM